MPEKSRLYLSTFFVGAFGRRAYDIHSVQLDFVAFASLCVARSHSASRYALCRLLHIFLRKSRIAIHFTFISPCAKISNRLLTYR